MSSAYKPPSSPLLIFVSRITPCIVDGIFWPVWALTILSDTTLSAFSCSVGKPKDIVMKNDTIRLMTGRAIYMLMKFERDSKR